MKKLVVYLEKSKQDLNEIYNYIAYYLYNEIAAKRIIVKIMSKIKQLSEFPFLYPINSDFKIKNNSVRSFSVENFIVFYTVESETDTVLILSVIYSKRDIINSDFTNCIER